MADMNLSLIVNLINNTQSGARKIGDALEGIQNKAKQASKGFQEGIAPAFTGEQFDKNINKLNARVNEARGKLLGAAGMLATIFAPLKKELDFEDQFIDFANVAEIPVDRQAEIQKQLVAQSRSTGKSRSELLEILAGFVGKGMGLEEAMAAVEATGRSATATKSTVKDMTNSGFAVMDNLLVGANHLQQAFDIMAASGKEGSFELAAMSRKFPSITAGARALKMEGLDAVASLSAALQISMKSAGSEDQAATNMENFLGKITAPDTVKKFKKAGVDIKKILNDAAKNGGDPMLAALQAIEKITKGDQFKMGELFQDKQVLDFLRAMIPNLEEYERIRDKARGADGIIDRDFEKVMKGGKQALKAFVIEIDNLFSASGGLLPLFKQLLAGATEFLRTVNDWTSANPELTATIVKGIAALLAFGAATRVLGFAWAVASRGIFGFLGLFFRFTAAGRNVSVVAKSVRGLAWAFKLIKPLSWALLIPRIGWKALAGVLRWGFLITPLKWLSVIPKLSWRLLIPVLRWTSRFIPVIGWAALAGELAWSLIIKPLGWDKYLNLDSLKAGLDKAKNWIAGVFGVDPEAAKKEREANPDDYDLTPRGWRKKTKPADEPVEDTEEPRKPTGAALRRNKRKRNQAVAPVYDPAEAGVSDDTIQQKIDAKIKTEIFDKRRPVVNITAPITVNEAAQGTGTAAQVRQELSNVVAKGQGGALHDGVD